MKSMAKKLVAILLVATLLVSVFCVNVYANTTMLKYGDANGDGKVTLNDVFLLQNYVLEKEQLTGDHYSAADVNLDKVVNLKDAAYISQFIAQKIDSLPVNVAGASWAQNSIGYEIFVRSFYDGNGDGIGDFLGIAEKVDYLKSLNVGFVWLMPFTDSTTYHGYDVTNYQAVNPDYGTLEDFKYMVDVLHQNGIKVVMDYVANHTSSENSWFKQALASKDSKYRDYYFISEDPVTGSGWRYNEEYNLYYYGLYDSIMPDLNYNNQAVRDDMKENAKFWIDQGVDGFRLDGANNIDADNLELTHSWWQEFTAYVKNRNPNAYVVGECWYSSMEEISEFYADFDSAFNFQAANTIANMSNGALKNIVRDLNEGYLLYESSAQATPNIPKTTLDSIMINNHDMDRIATRCETLQGAKLAAALQLTLPGTPFIYYGDELGQKGEKPDDNRREPFDWYASAEGTGMTTMTDKWFNPMKYTIANDGISLEEEQADSNSIFNYYKKLTEIRTENPQFFTGTYDTIGLENNLYSYVVSSPNTDEKIMVIHNLDSSYGHPILPLYNAEDILTGRKLTKDKYFTILPQHTSIIKFTGDTPPANITYTEPPEAETKEYTLTFEMSLPDTTPLDENIYITGTFNKWNECDEKYIMERTDATHAKITITVNGVVAENLEYKFTRGNWDKREQDIDGKDLVGDDHKENRFYKYSDTTTATITGTIERWSDLPPIA